jgi:hypothetical protein
MAPYLNSKHPQGTKKEEHRYVCQKNSLKISGKGAHFMFSQRASMDKDAPLHVIHPAV